MNDYEALKLRYRALSDDWNRLRDVEAQWRRLEKILFLVGAAMAIGAMVIIGGA